LTVGFHPARLALTVEPKKKHSSWMSECLSAVIAVLSLTAI